ncbi:MAG: hypothetical protein LBS06_03400 [Treponema sp.]|nr:hypothetical protein [Treponema sp.]
MIHTAAGDIAIPGGSSINKTEGVAGPVVFKRRKGKSDQELFAELPREALWRNQNG